MVQNCIEGHSLTRLVVPLAATAVSFLFGAILWFRRDRFATCAIFARGAPLPASPPSAAETEVRGAHVPGPGGLCTAIRPTMRMGLFSSPAPCLADHRPQNLPARFSSFTNVLGPSSWGSSRLLFWRPPIVHALVDMCANAGRVLPVPIKYSAPAPILD